MQCQRCGAATDPTTVSFDDTGLSVCRSCAAQVKIHVASQEAKPNFQGRVILGGLATTFLVGGCTLYRFAGKLGLVVAFGGFFLAVLCTIVAVMLPRRR